MHTPLEILKKYWHHQAFRPQQLPIIEALLQGNDVLALMPTGGGKSICYQVPALVKGGLCLVVSPLIALMKDQVYHLQQKGIAAVALHSGLTYYEVTKALQNAANGNTQFLYVSPERLETTLFQECVVDLPITLVAIDEAHCISQWGYDFRPPYLRIARLRQFLPPSVPFVAVTASATPLVQDDIVTKLQLRLPQIFKQSFERANISYSVFKVASKLNKAAQILHKVNGSAIIYCRNRKQTQQLTQLLLAQNIEADFYHAGLLQEERHQKQLAWLQGQKRVMVCTNAFGMGIDKADVRTVIHYDVPDCLENYYQEAGRAGRDGKKAYAVLLYQEKDLPDLMAMPNVVYPPIPTIQKVYQDLANFLNIPVGIGEGNYYNFNLHQFITNFRYDANTVVNTLKMLEQEGHLSFNEHIFLPSKISFTIDKSALDQLEYSHPQLMETARALLRTYEGIFNNEVSINEGQLSAIMRCSVLTVKKHLQQLHAFGIIHYQAQKETPQLHYLRNRAPAQYLTLNHEAYLFRKQQFADRVNQMLHFLQGSSQCRSVFIATYFGDTTTPSCGICDNCLEQKNNATHSTTRFLQHLQQVQQLLQQCPNTTVNALIKTAAPLTEKQLWPVLQYLQKEELLSIDAAGKVTYLTT